MTSERQHVWPSPEEYGRRFEDLNAALTRSFGLAEYRGDSPEDTAVLQYRLAKIAIAAEDIRQAIGILISTESTDDSMAKALIELRNACVEVTESFDDADPALVRLLNFLSS